MSQNNTKLSKEQVEHIAKLARIEISDADKEKFGGQLTSILDYVNKLSELDTEGVEPTSHVTGLTNVMRLDKAKICPDPKKLVEVADEHERGMVKVKKILDGGKQ